MTSAVAVGGALALGPAFLREALAANAVAGASPYGPLQPPDALGLMLPPGFTGREIARGGRVVGGYPWHFGSDGQATYRTNAGGWILVSNSETPAPTGGGSSAIRFAPDGTIERAYRILAGTNLNCAGGPTPWGTWLSCEEHPGGMVWEADPAGILPALPRPALGNFAHEAAAVDPVHEHVYLTEDEGDGCFYRFTPVVYPGLTAGLLEVAAVASDGTVAWHPVPDPNIVTAGKPTRQQVPQATHFNGGEGLWYDDGIIYFTTKGDRKVWAYDTDTLVLETIYDRSQAPDASLDAVDNVTVAASGDVYVCEDGGNMEIGIITPPGPDSPAVVAPFLRLTGAQHAKSEMAGVVFDPSGTRLYFASQRAYPYVDGTPAADGAIYEVTGPFRLPEGGVPASKVYGPPAGEQLELPVPGAERSGGLTVFAPARVTLGGLLRRGLRVRLELERAADVRLVLRTADARRVKSPRWHEARPVLTTLTARTVSLPAGEHVVTLPLRASAARQLPRRRSSSVELTAVAGGSVVAHRLTLTR